MLWTFALLRQYYNLSELWSHYRFLPIVGKTDLPWANSSKPSWGKFISGFVLPREKFCEGHTTESVWWSEKRSQIWILSWFNKKTLRQEWQYPKCEFLATCYLLNLGATRRYPELRGFASFVIDPKLVMNSTICWSTHSSLSHIRGIFLESLYSINSNFTDMSCKALFLYIISMCDENIINLIINLSPRNDPDPGVGIVSG